MRTAVADGSADERIVTADYLVGGDPLVSSVDDAADMTIPTTVDLLGRVVSCEDVWGTVTVPAHEPQTGRVLSTTTTPPVGGGIVQEYDYDADGKVRSVKVNGTLFADPTYATGQLLSSVVYANGSSLASIARDPDTGATTGMQWAFAGASASTVTDAVVRSLSGALMLGSRRDGWGCVHGVGHGGSMRRGLGGSDGIQPRRGRAMSFAVFGIGVAARMLLSPNSSGAISDFVIPS